ncbi:MAG: hypothetical protein WEA31_11090 [Pirellulales bacterium]
MFGCTHWRFVLVLGLLVLVGERNVSAQDPRRDPAVATIIDSNPQTPAELVKAAELLTRIGHPQFAKPYLDRLIALNLTDEQLASTVDETGVETFNRLRQYQNLPPEVAALANRALEAARTARLAPERLERLADQVISGGTSQRVVALQELRAAGELAAPPLLKRVAAGDDAETVAKATAALLLLGRDAVNPLIGALDTVDDPTKVRIYRIFGQLGSRQVVPYLLADAAAATNDEVRLAARRALTRLTGEVPSARDAQLILYRFSESLLDGSRLLTTDSSGNVTLWRWDGESNELTAKAFPEHLAQATLALRSAKEAHAIEPANEVIQRQFILASLQAVKLQGGLDRPLAESSPRTFDSVRELGFEVVEPVLSLAMERNHVPAAIAAAEVLAAILHADRAGASPQIDALTHRGAEPCPLAVAVSYSDRRVRFAALQAIMAAQPSGPFPGASYVTEALGYFASSSGIPHMAVVDAWGARAEQIGSLFLANGYEANTFRDPREFLLQTLPDGDLAFVLMELNVADLGADTLIAAVRRDYRTRTTPIGLMAAPDDLSRARILAAKDPFTVVFVQPRDTDTAALRVEQLTALAGWRNVPDDVRLQQARLALQYIAAEAAKSVRLFDVLQIEQNILRASVTPGLFIPGCEALASLGTRVSQRTLVDMASDSLRTEEVQQSAAAAFADSVRRFGVLLTSDEVRLQYDRYNASEQLDVETQQRLGGLLDVIEAGKAFPSTAAKPVVENP